MPYHSFIVVPHLSTASQPPPDRTIENIDAIAVQQIKAPVVFCIAGPGLETAKVDTIPGLDMYGKHCVERTLVTAKTDTVLAPNIHWKHRTKRTLETAKVDTLPGPNIYRKHCVEHTLVAVFKKQPAHADHSRRMH